MKLLRTTLSQREGYFAMISATISESNETINTFFQLLLFSGTCSKPNGDDYCGTSGKGGCFCDTACHSFGDCCADKVAVCGGQGAATTEDTWGGTDWDIGTDGTYIFLIFN